jgi:hypothetical protein
MKRPREHWSENSTTEMELAFDVQVVVAQHRKE